MDIAEDLVYLRIALTRMCDGFSSINSSKLTSLSIRTKILFLLKGGDLTPSELIGALCIAKSNLVNTVKPMIEEGVVVSYRHENNSKNVFYRLTDKGLSELREYKMKLNGQYSFVCRGSEEQISGKIKELTKLIKERIDIC